MVCFKAILILCILAGISIAQTAHAEVSEQIKSALAKGDYIVVQDIVSQNQDIGGEAELDILSIVLGQSEKNPEAVSLMTLAANLSPYISPATAGKIEGATKSITNKIINKGSQSAQDSETSVSMLNSLLTIAKSKEIGSQYPELSGWVQAQMDAFSEAHDVLLAQLPNSNYFPPQTGSRYIPNIAQPSFAPPPSSSASPSQ